MAVAWSITTATGRLPAVPTADRNGVDLAASGAVNGRPLFPSRHLVDDALGGRSRSSERECAMVGRDWNLKPEFASEALAVFPRKPNSDGEIGWGDVETAHMDTGCTRHALFGPWNNGHSPVLRPQEGLSPMKPNKATFDDLIYSGIPAYSRRVHRHVAVVGTEGALGVAGAVHPPVPSARRADTRGSRPCGRTVLLRARCAEGRPQHGGHLH